MDHKTHSYLFNTQGIKYISGSTEVNGPLHVSGDVVITSKGGKNVNVLLALESLLISAAAKETPPTVVHVSPKTDFYVSLIGNDAGDGSPEKPWITLTKALTVVNALPDTLPITIHVASGTYSAETSPCIVKRNNTWIVGSGVDQCTLKADIKFCQVATGDAVVKGGLQNISALSLGFEYSQPNQATQTVTFCTFQPDLAVTTVDIANVSEEVSTNTKDVVFRNCKIVSGAVGTSEPCTRISGPCTASFEQTAIHSNPDDTAYSASLIKTDGSNATVYCRDCSFINFSTADVSPLIDFTGTAPSTPYVFKNCSFQIVNSTQNSQNAFVFQLNTTKDITPSIQLLHCVFAVKNYHYNNVISQGSGPGYILKHSGCISEFGGTPFPVGWRRITNINLPVIT